MKNYLYILCAFLLAFAGCTKDADVEPIAPAPDGNTQVVLTGFSGRGTRTGFGDSPVLCTLFNVPHPLLFEKGFEEKSQGIPIGADRCTRIYNQE